MDWAITDDGMMDHILKAINEYGTGFQEDSQFTFMIAEMWEGVIHLHLGYDEVVEAHLELIDRKLGVFNEWAKYHCDGDWWYSTILDDHVYRIHSIFINFELDSDALKFKLSGIDYPISFATSV
jgi:hypothetical protein